MQVQIMDAPRSSNPQPAPARETFHQEFFRRAQLFIHDMLIFVPELEGVAIVPSWEVQQDRLPYGVLIGRNGPLQSPQEVVHMADQLHGALRTVMEASYNTLQAIDNRMAELAEEIRDKQQQLAQLNQELGLAGPPRGAAS
jgi:hypothetical protein